MSTISQYAIGSAQLAFNSSDTQLEQLDKAKLGAYFSTSLGATQVQSRNLNDLMTKGPAAVKSILFPDTVLNSALGNLSIAFGIQGCSANVSDLGNDGMFALWHGYYDLKSNKISSALVTSAEDSSQCSDKVWQSYNICHQSNQLQSSGTSLVLVNETEKQRFSQPVVELIDFFAGSLTFDRKDSQWSIPSLSDISSQLDDIDLVVISSLDVESENTVESVVDKYCPQAHVYHKPSDSVSCQSLNGITYAAQQLTNKRIKNDSEDANCYSKALVISINAMQSIAGCILSSIEEE